MYLGAKPDLFAKALNMRNNPTQAEKALWNQLRKLRKEGYIFRRQHPLDIFIADFYCHKIKLVIEGDGEIHSNEVVHEHDSGRTAELDRFGIRVIRFTNDQVMSNHENIMIQIKNIISELSSSALLGAGYKRG